MKGNNKKDFFDVEISELRNASKNHSIPTPSRKKGLGIRSPVNKKRKFTFIKKSYLFTKVNIVRLHSYIFHLNTLSNVLVYDMVRMGFFETYLEKTKKDHQKQKKKEKANELKEKKTIYHIEKVLYVRNEHVSKCNIFQKL